MSALPDTFVRWIRRSGQWEAIRGDTGIRDGIIDRDDLVSGTYNPVYYSGTPAMGGDYSTNRVGYYGPSSIVQEQEGTNLTYSTNGQTITGIDFYRRVSVSGQNITFVGCIFRGTPTDATAPLTCGSASVNATFIDCTFAPMAPQHSTQCARMGVGGGTFLRCDFYGGIDGIANNSTSGWPQQWNFLQCAWHDMVHISPDPGASGGLSDNAGHTDTGIQWGGGRMRIDGCGIWAFYDMNKYQADEMPVDFGSGTTTATPRGFPYHMFGNKYTDTVARAGDARTPAATVGGPSIYSTSCVMHGPMYLPIQNEEITNCYLDGSTWPINMGDSGITMDPGTPFTFTGNKIGTNHRWAQNGGTLAILARSALASGMSISGNTNLITGAALSTGQVLDTF
jgi:hypothetical protein